MKEGWHTARSKGIGSSDIAAMLGLNKYMTPYHLWEIKTGRAEYSGGNEFIDAGKMLEPAILSRFYQENDNLQRKDDGEQQLFVHPKFPQVRVTPDSIYEHLGGYGCVEAKSTQKRQIDQDSLPQSWYLQLQYQIGTMKANYPQINYNSGYVVWLEHGLNFRWLEFDFDEELYYQLIDEVVTWWQNHVVEDTPPEPLTAAEIAERFPSHTPGKAIEATEELAEVYRELLEKKQLYKALEEKIDGLAEQVKLIMRDAERVVYGGETLFTYKQGRDSERVDTARAKEMGITKIVPGIRRFLVK